MIWPFKTKTAPIQDLIFKDSSAFIEFYCKFCNTKIEQGVGIAGIVLDAKKEFGASAAVRVEADGHQRAALRVASDDGGFLVMAVTPNAGELLKPNDLVMWVPYSYNYEVGKAARDPRFGWIGMIRARIDCVFPIKILTNYD